MQTVEIEIEESVLSDVDDVAANLQTDRNKFIQTAIRKAIHQARRRQSDKDVEQQYAQAYGKFPVQPDEFEIDEDQLIEAWKDL